MLLFDTISSRLFDSFCFLQQTIRITQTSIPSLFFLFLLLLFLPCHRHEAPRESQHRLPITPSSLAHPAAAQQPNAARRAQLRGESAEQNGSHESAERFDDVVIREGRVESARRSDGGEEMHEGGGEDLLADGVEGHAEQQILRAAR